MKKINFFRKKIKRGHIFCSREIFSLKLELLRCFDGNLAELLEVLHEFEGGLTGTGTGGLVSFDELLFSILSVNSKFSCDFLYELFHDFWF